MMRILGVFLLVTDVLLVTDTLLPEQNRRGNEENFAGILNNNNFLPRREGNLIEQKFKCL